MANIGNTSNVSRRNFLKIAAAGVAIAAAEASGLAPRFRAAAAPLNQTGTLRVAWGGAPATLDPLFSSADAEIAFLNAVYDYLIDTNAQSELLPRLATGWEVSEDGLTYTLQIAEGVKFHDGSDLSVNDVIWTFNRLRDAELGGATVDLYANIASIEAGEGSSVVFTLTATNPDFLFDLSDNHAVVLKENAENIGTDFNGTGAFVLQEYLAEDRATFTTNAEYWGGVPAVEGLEFIYFADTEASINALRGGLVDVVLRLDNATFLSLSEEADFNAVSVPTSGYDTFRIRSDREPGSDERVRRAFRLATDRQAIFERVQLGFGAVGRDAPISPVFAAYYTEATELPARDPEAARALLTEAGFADGLDITLYVPNLADRVAFAQALASQWEEAGIRATIEPQEEAVYYAEGGWLDVDFAITPWGARPTPNLYLVTSLKTDAIWNESHFSDEELDGLIDVVITTLDETERANAYGEIQRILIERGPLILPYFFASFGVSAANVQNFELHPFPGRTDLRHLTV